MDPAGSGHSPSVIFAAAGRAFADALSAQSTPSVQGRCERHVDLVVAMHDAQAAGGPAAAVGARPAAAIPSARQIAWWVALGWAVGVIATVSLHVVSTKWLTPRPSTAFAPTAEPALAAPRVRPSPAGKAAGKAMPQMALRDDPSK
jgi:hypothetical protein